ncbi:MAG TPA: ATP-binding protein, partial [Flavobacteriaceae bacterium]|nr:ATP-binding protein [Flavobacteriaceae bacterium]
NQPQEFYKDLWDTILSGKDWIGELLNKKKNGELFWEKAVISPILNGKGEVTNFVTIKDDITERKKAEQALNEAKERAEQSDQLKSAFLANMSHEIRTPMNGILGFAELLKKPDLTGEKQQQYIKIIEKSGARMLNMINDIVSISKIESGTMEIHLKETNINNQLQFVYDVLRLDAEKKNLQLSLNCEITEKEVIIKTDSDKFYGILSNLVKNAIKYTDSGTIEFGYTDKGKEFEFYVKDTGIGIPKEKQEAIFERFIQADIEDKMARQGAGLGLAISRAYVAMLGGKIWVESKIDEGSIFYFTIPSNSESAVETLISQHKKLEINKDVKKLKILIAEDDEVSEMLLDETVKMFGKEILKARTGVEAVEICRNNPDINLILMDIQMPEMSGYKASNQIREFNKEVIIIAQTAYGLSGDREKSIESGCNDYIKKPINKTALQAMIQKYS